MRLFCWSCAKSVSNEVPEDTILRAVCICPECIEAKKVIFPEDETPKEREHEWEFYFNGSFCKRCGAAIGSGVKCR